jgi:hypothetical protein
MASSQVLSALARISYSFSDSTLTIHDQSSVERLKSLKMDVQSRYSVAISFKKLSAAIRHGSESSYCAILGELIGCAGLSQDIFVSHATAPPQGTALALCFPPPQRPPVPPPLPDSPPQPATVISRPRAAYRNPIPRVDPHIPREPPRVCPDACNPLLRYYEPVAAPSARAPVISGRPKAPHDAKGKAAAHAPSDPPKTTISIEMHRPEQKKTERRFKSADGKKLFVILGEKLDLSGSQEMLAGVRVAVLKMLGLPTSAQVARFIFQ